LIPEKKKHHVALPH